MRLQIKKHNLNYDWHFTPSFDKNFIKEFPKSEIVNIPHTVTETPLNNFSEKIYQMISSYQKEFNFEKTKGKRYILRFEGVMEYCEVYLNGKLITSHKGGYTPFKTDITKQLVTGVNKLFVMVDSTERKDIPPHGFVVDYMTYGGIYREVFIEEQNSNFIDMAFIHVDYDEINIRMFIDANKQVSTVFKFNIFKGDQLAYFFEREYDLQKLDINVREKVYLDEWSLEEPTLYTLEIFMDDDFAYSDRFGNRKIEFTDEGFFLNRKHIKLMGLNRHQSYPYVGYAMPSNAQKKDADILKYELGCNVVRSSHYPPSKHFLDRCDEIGLLVFDEIPGWQHIGDEAWQEVAITNVREMIYRDYNHASIFIWGVRINESPDNDQFYYKTDKMARSLDTIRPTGGVRNFKGSKLIEDVYTYNDFVHRGDNEGLERPKSVTKKSVPYLVTEYNGHMYPTKKFDDEYHREYQVKRHLRVQNDSFGNPNIAGAIGWCMFDYNTHKDFGSGDRICYHGVMDMFRIPKYAAAVYTSQGIKEPFIKVASMLQIGEREAGEIKNVTVLTNAEYIKFYINDDFIGDFYPSDEYGNLPYPPVIIDDFIGNLIHKHENFSDGDATKIKNILLSIMRHGMKISLRKKLQMFMILKKHKMSIDQAAKLYEKYVGKWGLESLTYRFDAIKAQLVVASQTIGTYHTSDLHVKVDDVEIKESETYETTRIVIEHLDEFLNPLLYSIEVLTVKVKGPLKIIGPSKLALIGGSIGFYVKTIGEKGTAKITIESNNFETKIIEIKVS